MKSLIIVFSIMTIGFNLNAQEDKKTKTPVQKESKENPKKDKRAHAEEKSKGNAYSGNGKGGDKNLVDPVDKPKKEKKPKKVKK